MRKKFSSIFCALLPLCFFAFSSPISTLASEKKEAEPVQVQLVSEEKSIQPGHPFWVGVELKMADGWDTYWINPGDAGFPTKVDWHLPQGLEAGPLKWPYPERFTNQSMTGFGYTHSVLLLAQITPSKEISSNEMTLLADVSWLACKDQCQPGSAKVSLTLPITSATPEKNEAQVANFEKAHNAVPRPLHNDEGALSVAAQAEKIVLNVQAASDKGFGEVTEALFIPEQAELIDHGAPQQLIQKEGGFSLSVKRANPESALPDTMKGVLLISEKGSSVKKAIHVETSTAAASATTTKTLSLGLALLFAFVGGLILNVMPCVLPVIALKIFGFVKIAHHQRSVILKHGGVFALGVLLSFWILSGILLILRAYGEGIGWGFQLQEPLFVAILAAVLFLLGLSLFGVFELGTSLISLGHKSSEGGSPLKSSFMSGILATVVATPCTGPLLGPALGFAMTLPPITALSVFTMMGIGMASPYLLFSAFPSLIRFLPKPGNWMIVFKQLMGFLMMATVVWLLWVFASQTDTIAVFVMLASLLLFAIGAWIYGKWATPARRRITRLLSTAVTMVIFVIGGAGAFAVSKQQQDLPAIAHEEQTGSWIAFSPEKVAALRAEGKPVFVDFTAKWCLICQANKVVLHSADITSAFQEKGVVTMTADWTKRDVTISKELEKLGRNGVPVYVLYPADTTQPPYILPQTLTSSLVNDYLNKLPS